MTRSAPRLLFVLALAGALAACDSNDTDGPTPSDVAGVYNVTTFTFDPDIQVLETISVRDTLVADQTTMEILSGGQVFLRYRLQNSPNERLVLGEASVRSEQVRVTFDDGTQTDRRRILLPSQVTFDRDGTTLSAEAETTVNLEAYSPRFGTGGTFREVDGTLRITLTPRASS